MAGTLGAIAIATCTLRGIPEGAEVVGHRFSGAGNRVADSPLQKQVSAIAASDGGRVGAAALLIETGERIAVRGGERFPMQSVFKLPVALQVLHEVDAGRAKLDMPVTLGLADLRPGGYNPIATEFPGGVTLTIEDLLRPVVSGSDNTAVDALMKRTGGPAAVTKRLRDLGIADIRVDRSEQELARALTGRGALERYERDPRDTATPDAAVDLLVKVLGGGDLLPPSQQRLRTWMTESPTGSKRLKGLLPAGTPVAHKMGTGPDREGVNAATNDIGLILLPGGRHMAVAVFIAKSRQSLDEREAIIARIAKAAYDYWTP
jgi:beta-lactamase class A